MRVVLATFDDDPPLGGQGVLVRSLRAALLERGVEVVTVAGHGSRSIPVRRLTGRAPLDMTLALWRDPRPLLEPRPDLVHAMGGPGGVLLQRRLPVPVVYTANHTYGQAYGRRDPRALLGALEARAYRRAAAVMAISPSTAAAVRRLGVAAERIHLVWPGIDAVRLDRGDSLRQPGRLLFVGRLEVEKGPLDAVAVMAEARRRRPGVTGVIVGTGRQQSEVVAAARTAGAIRVLGAVDDDTLAAELAAAEVVLVPSRYEGLGLVALEAMAAGAAVVATDVTGLRDAVSDAALLVSPGDRAAMTAAALRLLEDDDERGRLVARGRELVRTRHSWAEAARLTEDVYRRVLGRRAAEA